MDLILVLLLFLVLGGLVWLERARLGPFIARPAPAAENGAATGSYYWRLTRQAGLSPYDSWPLYIAAKVLIAAALVALAMWLGIRWLALVLAPVGFMLPDALLAYIRRERQGKIRRALSFFFDLLVSLLQAGLGVEEAFARTAREGLPRDHPLAEEAMRVVEELKLGRDRTLGFQTLADRTGVAELKSLSAALAVGVTQGGSIEGALRAQAEVLRAHRREEGMRRLNVVGAQVLLPLMLCGFPVFLVLVLAPLAIRLAQSLATLAHVLQP